MKRKTVIIMVILFKLPVPWANKYGAMSGLFSSLALNMWLSVGHRLYGRNTAELETLSTDGCHGNSTTAGSVGRLKDNIDGAYVINNTHITFHHSTMNTTYTPVAGCEQQYELGVFVYDISYEWYSVIGCVVCVGVGLTVSYFTRIQLHTCNDKCTSTQTCSENGTDPALIFPFLRRYWGLSESVHENANDQNVDIELNYAIEPMIDNSMNI